MSPDLLKRKNALQILLEANQKALVRIRNLKEKLGIVLNG